MLRSKRWGTYGPGHDCEEVHVKSRFQGQAQGICAEDAQSLTLEEQLLKPCDHFGNAQVIYQ